MLCKIGFTKNDFLTLLTVSLMKSIVGFITSVVIPIFPTLIEQYFSNNSTLVIHELIKTNKSLHENPANYDYGKLSLLYTTKNICQVSISLLMGFIIDYIGARYVMVIGGLFQLMTVLLYGLASTYPVLLVGRITEAIASTSINTAVSALIAYKFTDSKKRGFFFGFVGLCLCCGSSLGPLYGGWMFEKYSKTIVFLSIVLLIGLELILTIILIICDKAWSFNNQAKKILKKKCLEISLVETSVELFTENLLDETEINKDKENVVAKTKTSSNCNFNVFKFIQDPYFLICIGSFPTLLISIFVYFATLPRYMHVEFSASESQQGMVWTLTLVGYFVGFAIGNFINSKLHCHRHITLMFIGYVHGASVLIASIMPVWWAISLPLCVMVSQHLIMETVLAPLLATIVERRHKAKYGVMSGLIMMAVSCTSSIGSLTGPLLYSAIGFVKLNLIIFIINVIYSPLYLILREYIS